MNAINQDDPSNSSKNESEVREVIQEFLDLLP